MSFSWLRRPLASFMIAAATLLAAMPAEANRDWLPCNLLTPGGAGVLTPAGRTGSFAGDRAVKPTHPWQFEFRHAVADFDRFEGAAIEPIKLRSTALGLSRRFGSENKWSIGVLLPYHDIDSETFRASGIGDTDLHASVLLAPAEVTINDTELNAWLELLLGATLPTGDESESLGFGDPTARIGLVARIGRDDTHEWVHPYWQISLGAHYGHHFGNSDISSATTHLTLRGSAPWRRKTQHANTTGDPQREALPPTLGQAATPTADGPVFVYSVGIATEWELTDSVELRPGVIRDDRHQSDFVFALGFIPQGDRFELLFGARIALDDGGLRDEIIPTLHGIVRFGEKITAPVKKLDGR